MWKGRIAGHPVHLMLVHFPIALFAMDLVCSILGIYTADPSFPKAAYYALWGGVTLGWLASIFGVMDLGKIKEEKVLRIAFWHGGLALIYLIFYSVLLRVRVNQFPNLPFDPVSLIVVKSLAILLLFITAFLGGELVFKHKVT